MARFFDFFIKNELILALYAESLSHVSVAYAFFHYHRPFSIRHRTSHLKPQISIHYCLNAGMPRHSGHDDRDQAVYAGGHRTIAYGLFYSIMNVAALLSSVRVRNFRFWGFLLLENNNKGLGNVHPPLTLRYD